MSGATVGLRSIKRGAETLKKSYFDAIGLDVRIARIFNTYGPNMRMHDGRVVANFIAAALEEQPLKVNGDGSQTRSFGYVDDTVRGLYALLMADFNSKDTIFDRVFNIGTPEECTITELAKKIGVLSEKYLNKTPKIVWVNNPDKTDPRMRLPDIEKARRKLGFNPKVCLDEGLEKTFVYCYETFFKNLNGHREFF